MNYKNMKVFDCFYMPQKVRNDFFEHFSGKGNSVYVKYYTCDGNSKHKSDFKDWSKSIKYENDFEYGYEPGDDPISDWLLDNGAEAFEEVLILHSW